MINVAVDTWNNVLILDSYSKDVHKSVSMVANRTRIITCGEYVPYSRSLVLMDLSVDVLHSHLHGSFL